MYTVSFKFGKVFSMIKISTSVKILTALIYVPTTLGVKFYTILTVLGEVGILLKEKII